VKENLPLEEKQAVWCIVKHWSEDKYLFIEWNKKYANWTNFITGGIDTGEDVVQTAIREVAEESGYVDVKKAENLNNSIIAEFYHTYKNKNFSTEFHWVYIELASGKQVSVLEEEKDKHTTIWIDKNKVESFHSTPNGKYGWRVFTGLESKCFTDDGKLVNSGKFNRLNSEEARKRNYRICWWEDCYQIQTT
jgi:8-oxo-dGTP pyrophosphatase MutT (NUDIX family)